MFFRFHIEKDAFVLSKYKALYHLEFCLAIVCEKSLENNYKTITTTHQNKCSFFLKKKRRFAVCKMILTCCPQQIANRQDPKSYFKGSNCSFTKRNWNS